jgi:hypothetical protein
VSKIELVIRSRSIGNMKRIVTVMLKGSRSVAFDLGLIRIAYLPGVLLYAIFINLLL